MTILEQIEEFASENELDLRIFTKWQIRFMKDYCTSVDLYLPRYKMCFIARNEWIDNEDLDQAFERILNHFQDESLRHNPNI